MKRLPIGVSDFKKLRDSDFYYIDKTLFIKEVLDKKSEVLLLPRPRRFGKTLNLSMLYYFFSNANEYRNLFDNTAIAHYPDIMAHQGQYPVIFLTFKDVKVSTWQQAFNDIAMLVKQVFERYYPVLVETMSESEHEDYKNIMHRTADLSLIAHSLKTLGQLLYRHYHKKIIILLDEYDAPIHAAYQYGYYQEMTEFIRNFLSAALKDNTALEFGVLTGILRTAKEGIFSGLNNLNVCTILNEDFSDKFGFTQEEVDTLLEHYALMGKRDEVKQWYNGYQFANTTVYNPWSLISFVDKKGAFGCYWANTSDNALIKRLITHASTELLMQLESVLHGAVVRQRIEEAFIVPSMERNELIVWSLLVFTGYLTPKRQELVKGRFMGDLTIPNQEIYGIYDDLLQEILRQPLQLTSVRVLLRALQEGDGVVFEKIVREYLQNSISMFDLPNNEPEKSYHLFVLGLLVTLSDTYEVLSNRESGYGRYDIMLIPKNLQQRGVIIEFKKVDEREELEEAAQRALQQIHAQAYVTQMRNRGVSIITAFGIAFKGKEVLLKQEVV